MKKIFIPLIVILVALGLAFGVWRFFAQQGAAPEGTVPSTLKRTFNPFGLFGTDTGAPSASSTETASTTEESSLPSEPGAVVLVSQAPVAGAVLLSQRSGTTTETVVRYVQRDTGNIYEYTVETGAATRISNTTIPRIQRALFGNNGNNVALQYVEQNGETVSTYLGSIAPKSASTTDATSRLSGSFLPQNILTLALHPTANHSWAS